MLGGVSNPFRLQLADSTSVLIGGNNGEMTPWHQWEDCSQLSQTDNLQLQLSLQTNIPVQTSDSTGLLADIISQFSIFYSLFEKILHPKHIKKTILKVWKFLIEAQRESESSFCICWPRHVFNLFLVVTELLERSYHILIWKCRPHKKLMMKLLNFHSSNIIFINAINI